VQAAEAFYSRRSLPAVFQISAATGASSLDALLANRGYGVSGISEVWTLKTRTFKAKQAHGEWAIGRSNDPDEAWFDCAFDEIAERRRVHEQIVRRAPQPRLFVSASAADGAVVGCGMATSARGHAGIFCMATRTTHRRRGVGLALVRELCAWAVEQADQRIFLQVMTENEAAKKLYRKMGFEFAYRYHYRVR
jgi:ribosomal protein S18 acetylase RimI-like enzyme